MNTKKLRLSSERSRFFISLSIIGSSFLICLLILSLSGGLSLIFVRAKRLLPKFPKFQEIQEINTTSIDVATVISTQPKISFNKNAKYVIIESSSPTCSGCAEIYKQNESTSTYDKLMYDFIESGKLDYLWIDNARTNTDVLLQSSIYCVSEQSSKKFFEYKKFIYTNKPTSDINTLKSIVKSLDLDENKFADCVNSNKYAGRVEALTELSTTLDADYDPTFFVYKVEEKSVETADKRIEKRIVASQVLKIDGSLDYDVGVKTDLDSIFK